MVSDRRTLLRRTALLCPVAVAGCLEWEPTAEQSKESPTPTLTLSCPPADPPAPTDANLSPKPYPDRPTELARDPVADYVTSFERAFQYNATLADYPDLFGRTNSLDVHVENVSVEGTGPFTATVSGEVTTSIESGDGTAETPETPTATPLPSGHEPFEESYTVGDAGMARHGITHACW